MLFADRALVNTPSSALDGITGEGHKVGWLTGPVLFADWALVDTPTSALAGITWEGHKVGWPLALCCLLIGCCSMLHAVLWLASYGMDIRLDD